MAGGEKVGVNLLKRLQGVASFENGSQRGRCLM